MKEILKSIWKIITFPCQAYKALDDFYRQDQIEESRMMHEPWDESDCE